MSTLAVTAERLTILPHPNADALELAQVGGYRAVVAKGAYVTGDYAIYIPEQAIIPDPLIEELGLTGRLAGGKHNRVKAITLRGELSQGIVCRPMALAQYDMAQAEATRFDFAELLGITKWVPEVPASMAGKMMAAPGLLAWIEIENIKRYPDMFVPGEPVTASEKLHGCLAGNTRILMPDFTWRTIKDLVAESYRGEILGMDDEGRIVPTPVLNTFNNGKTSEWLHITTTRAGGGRSSSKGSVTVTPNHRLWSPNHALADSEGYVRADQLSIGDQVWIHRTEVALTPLAEQVLIGKMLGDGHLERPRSTSGTAAVMFGHASKHDAYVEWTAAALGELCVAPIDRKRVSGYGTSMSRTHTVRSSLIYDRFVDWIVDGHKQVPESAVDDIGPIALAYWYMDDGSLAHALDQEDRAALATNGFDESSVDRLLRALAKFGIKGVKYQSHGRRIRLNSDDTERFFLLVAPHIPPVMQYKLPERYRGGSAYAPSLAGAYKPMLRPQTVTAIASFNRSFGLRNVANPRGSSKYDLETGTHNFFANGILVHNSACLLTVDNPGNLFVSSKGFGSKRLAIIEDANNVYWRAIRVHGIEERVRAILARLGVASLGLFAEVYGAGIQDLTYGVASRNTPGIAVFDARMVNAAGQEAWLDQGALRALCAEVGIPVVPELYAGPYDYAHLSALAEGQTLLGGGNIREGLVVRPLIERTYPALNSRAIAKFVSTAYLTRGGNATEYE